MVDDKKIALTPVYQIATLTQDEQHYRHFCRMLAEMDYGKGRNTPRLYATLFLLTANESI